MSTSRPPKAILFDLDDTILDDSGCVERSWTDACAECCAAQGPEATAAAGHNA
jgi:beta-phosphoglucomutase-like phosphatase (HAD superfamily)